MDITTTSFTADLRGSPLDVDQACGFFPVEHLHEISKVWVLNAHRDTMRSPLLDKCLQLAMYPVGLYIHLGDGVSSASLLELRERCCKVMDARMNVVALPYDSQLEKIDRPAAVFGTVHHMHVDELAFLFKEMDVNLDVHLGRV